MTTRSYPATTSGTLTYDAQDQLLRWSATTASNNEEEWYFYDAEGNRVLRRSATTDLSGNPATSAATITVYPFGLEEHAYQYSGSGSSQTLRCATTRDSMRTCLFTGTLIWLARLQCQ